MDGLIVDTDPAWRRAEIEQFARVGIRLTETACRQTMGLRIDEVVRFWHARQPWIDPPQPALVDAIVGQVADAIRRDGRAMPGVGRVLGMFERRGIPMAIASSSPLMLIETVVDVLGIANRFDALCSAMDEAAGKPDPDVFLAAARRLGADPARCIAFEDSLAGVRAAAAAGMYTVFVPERGHDELAPQADRTVASLELFAMDQE